MRRLALLLAAIFAGGLLASNAAAGPGIQKGVIAGGLLDVTCYGPCAPGTSPHRFEGDADAVVSERGSRREIARVPAEKGRYDVAVPSGRYRVVAIPYPEQDSLCWQGTPRRVNVEVGEVKHRRLVVENVCVQ